MKKLILKALAQFPDRPVLIPVIANIIGQSQEAIKMIKGLLLKECARYRFDVGRITPARIEAELEQRVRAALPKMAKDGLVKHLDIHEIRAGKDTGERTRDMWHSKPIRAKRPTPAQFREEVKKLKVVFSDWDQLNHAQGAYQITKRGLGEVEATDGIMPAYIAKPIAM